MKKILMAAAAAVMCCAGSALANLTGDAMQITITHTGVAGGMVGPAVLNHTYGGPPSIFPNQFFGSFLVASPAAAPGFDNALLVDFSLFNYSGFANNFGTLAVAGLAEDVNVSSLSLFAGTVGMGPNIGTNISGAGGTFSVTWDTDTIFNPTGPDAMVVAWNSAPVPAPGALALLGAAGLVARRRRRRA